MCSVRSFFSIFFQQISTSTSGLHICSSITSALSFFFHFFIFLPFVKPLFTADLKKKVCCNFLVKQNPKGSYKKDGEELFPCMDNDGTRGVVLS